MITIYTGSVKNYGTNPGSENDDTSWVIEEDASAVDISNELQNVHNGNFALQYWANTPFEFTDSQTITGLENGSYTFSARMQGGGGDTLQLYASDFGGETVSVDFTTTAWREWKNPTIENIVVTNGQCTISLKVAAGGGTWGFFDDAGLFMAELQ